MTLDVLAIGAHPDDIELACGGTLITLVRQGKRVGILDLTAGELGTRGTAEIRAREADEGAQRLGVHTRENLGLPDGNIAVNVENRNMVIRVLRRLRPAVLLMPHWLERHPDHEHAHALAREAWFYAGLSRIETEDNGKLQEPFRPRSYFHFMQSYEFIPSFVVDITDVIEERMHAVMAFSSQFHNPASTEPQTMLSSPEFLLNLRTRFAYYGDRVGVRFGEPFFSVNMVGVRDLFSVTL